MTLYRPQHKVAADNVDVPTIMVTTVESLTDGNSATGVYLQWFGDSWPDQVPAGSQFFFPVGLAVDDDIWGGQLETFRVAFVGQIKDWPAPRSAQGIADQFGHGSLDGWVLYLISAEVMTVYPPHPDRLDPTAFVVPLTVMLADPNCGVIKPRPYDDLAVVTEEINKASRKGGFAYHPERLQSIGQKGGNRAKESGQFTTGSARHENPK